MPGGGCKMPITRAHAWGRCIHQDQASLASQSIPTQQIHLNPLKRCPLSPGQPGRAPVPASPSVPARGPCAPPSLQCDLSRAGSAAGQPQREKTAIAFLLISALSGWRDTRGVGAGTGAARTAQGVTPRLPPKSCSGGGTRFRGRLIPFGAPLLHRYRIDIKQIEDTQGQVPALLKIKAAFPARIVHISMPDPRESKALLMHRTSLNKALNPAHIYSHAPYSLCLFIYLRLKRTKILIMCLTSRPPVVPLTLMKLFPCRASSLSQPAGLGPKQSPSQAPLRDILGQTDTISGEISPSHRAVWAAKSFTTREIQKTWYHPEPSWSSCLKTIASTQSFGGFLIFPGIIFMSQTCFC